MHKYNIMGHEMIKLRSLGYAIRKSRKLARMFFTGEQLEAANRALDNIVRQVYLDEIRAAKTEEEKEAIVLEIPGDFMVYRIVDAKKRSVDFFMEFSDGHPVATLSAARAMTFAYESKAKEIAENLGDDWKVWDMCDDASEDTQHIIKVLFDEGDDSE